MKIDRGTFIDVGAHIGRYTVQIGRGLDGTVVALEPHPENYELLLKNIALNGLSNVKAFPYAASDVNGSGSLWGWKNDAYERGMYTLRYGEMGVQGWKFIEKVKTVRLDDLIEGLGINDVYLVKLDVEGFEYRVFKGMPRILSTKPKIAFEGDLSSRIVSYLGEFGYRDIKHVGYMNLGE